MSVQYLHHPYSTVLRQRAAHLRDLATMIESSSVMALDDDHILDAQPANRTEFCQLLLTRNLHQLHEAADDLRYSAFRLRQQADELDLGGRGGFVA